jgi:hypothetical protein
VVNELRHDPGVTANQPAAGCPLRVEITAGRISKIEHNVSHESLPLTVNSAQEKTGNGKYFLPGQADLIAGRAKSMCTKLMQVMAATVAVKEEAHRSATGEMTMRKPALFLMLAGSLTTGTAEAGEDAKTEAFAQESRALVKAFAGELKGELQATIETGGPIHAISVCNVRAAEIATDLSTPGQWSVGRTSHRVRNPSNVPDAWEAGVLEEFRLRAAAGDPLKGMEIVERFQDDGGTTYRYMKAIPVGQVCLTCHGTDIDPELKAEIDGFYPNDQAIGFALGELRGAFTVTKTAKD